MGRVPYEQLSPTQQAILDIVRREPGRWNRSGLAKLLVGSSTSRTVDLAGHPDFGLLSGRGRKGITFEIDILIQQGYLTLEHHQNLMPA